MIKPRKLVLKTRSEIDALDHIAPAVVEAAKEWDKSPLFGKECEMQYVYDRLKREGKI